MVTVLYICILYKEAETLSSGFPEDYWKPVNVQMCILIPSGLTRMFRKGWMGSMFKEVYVVSSTVHFLERDLIC